MAATGRWRRSASTHSLRFQYLLKKFWHGLAANLLDESLLHATRIKVVRTAAVLSEALQLPWASIARAHSLRIGGGQRWIAVTKSGERLDLKRP